MWKLMSIVLAFGLFQSSVSHAIEDNVPNSMILDQFVDSKVAAGIPANKSLQLDYAYLDISFINQRQTCGGVLVSASWVLTSATCLQDPAEGIASTVLIGLGNTGKADLTYERIVIHPEYKPEARGTNDIALIKLAKASAPDGKKLAVASLAKALVEPATYTNKAFVFCGFGSTANKPTPSKGLLCTTLLGTAKDEAKNKCSGEEKTLCTTSPNENNVCPGDFGGPLYQNADGKQTVVGISSYSPDLKSNAPCLGGHAVTYSLVASFDADFIQPTLLT